jgi:hypothetical protein
MMISLRQNDVTAHYRYIVSAEFEN